MDVDQWWRQLGTAALLGTAKRKPPSVAELNLGDAFTPTPRPDPTLEHAALDAAALGGALRRAGQLPTTTTAQAPACPPERVPEAPPRAAQLLDLLLRQPPTDQIGTRELLTDWCLTCHQAARRVPHPLVPALLDRASTTELRGKVTTVVGERGHWLARQNPDWAWLEQGSASQAQTADIERTAGGAVAVDPDAWALLSTDARVAQLTLVRSNDPAAGRDLLATTWANDSAKDRRDLLETLHVNLGPGDEDFLEAGLDDRAATVRELASRILDALSDSRRARRMADRLRPLLHESGLLRRHLEVRLPDDPDAAGIRDGLGKPPTGRSSRGWWIERLAAGASFDAWGAPADKVVPRLQDPDALAGLRRAAVVRRAPDWARALLDLGQGLDPALLAALPPQERETRVLDALKHTQATSLVALLNNMPGEWSAHLSAAVISRLAGLKAPESGPALEVLMPHLVRGLHPDAIPALQRWRAAAELTPRQDSKLGSLIQSHTLRHTISEAFQS